MVVLESKCFVYNVSNLALLRTLDLPAGAGKGASALSSCDEPSLLALPASASTGALRVYDLLFGGGNVVTEVRGPDVGRRRQQGGDKGKEPVRREEHCDRGGRT